MLLKIVVQSWANKIQCIQQKRQFFPQIWCNASCMCFSIADADAQVCTSVLCFTVSDNCSVHLVSKHPLDWNITTTPRGSIKMCCVWLIEVEAEKIYKSRAGSLRRCLWSLWSCYRWSAFKLILRLRAILEAFFQIETRTIWCTQI